MRILITGSAGQLGQALQQRLAGFEVEAHDLATLDLTEAAAVAARFDAFKPQLVVNAAAYTAVDKAEADSMAADVVNHQVVATLAENCRRHGARLIHVSTDFVFDGTAGVPYAPDAPVNPLSVYGKTKHDGELALQRILPGSGVVIRTAWLYSAIGNNFVKTMLRLMRERKEIRVVCDQVGTPTHAGGLAEVIRRMALDASVAGVFHWTDAGVASWYDFAVAIYEEGCALGMLPAGVNVLPIPSVEYPTPARRPSFSVLDKAESYRRFQMPATHWRVHLREVLAEIAEQEK